VLTWLIVKSISMIQVFRAAIKKDQLQANAVAVSGGLVV
jgi:hypothetical protein